MKLSELAGGLGWGHGGGRLGAELNLYVDLHSRVGRESKAVSIIGVVGGDRRGDMGVVVTVGWRMISGLGDRSSWPGLKRLLGDLVASSSDIAGDKVTYC